MNKMLVSEDPALPVIANQRGSGERRSRPPSLTKRALVFLLLLLVPAVSHSQESETLRLLQDLIRIDTSNPPGNETAAVHYIAHLLTGENIPFEIIESAPGRGNLIARLKGDGSKPSMLLLGHLDVVPADPKEWRVPPFAAEVKDGLIWGRGSLDMKGLVAMEISAFLRLKRENIPLGGDVILTLTADEEAGGHQGAGFLVANHWDKIEAKYVFNEGSVGVRKKGLHLYPIQVAEKGIVWMRLTAHGTSGHGSRPIDDNAVVTLSRVVERLAAHRFPIRKTPVLETFLERISPHLEWYQKLGIKLLFVPVLGPVIQKVAAGALLRDKTLKAIVANTLTPTMLSAGYKVNVIPAQAVAEVDGRILPGEMPESFLKTIQALAGDKVTVEATKTSLPNESDFKTPYFRAIEKAIHAADPEAITAPMMSAGGTDSRFFREKGAIAYGIIPLLLEEEMLEGLHGKDERIPFNQLEKGAQVVYDVVVEMQSP